MNRMSRLSGRVAWVESIGTLTLLMGSTAFAQQTAATAQQGLVLEEVVVTAQKRAESIQDVPTSVSVFSSEKLEQLHATQLSDYAAYLPGFNLSGGGAPGQSSITLRGIAPVASGAVVGTYIDDTPVGSSGGRLRGEQFYLDLMPYDVSRVEVLRGPQGTLYGAGAMGGILKYVTRDPDLSDLEIRAGVETSAVHGADDMGWGARLGVNAPLIADKLAVRASYFTQETPGFIDNDTLGEDINEVKQRGGRVSLLWQLTDDVSVKLGGMWQRAESDNNAVQSLDLTRVDPPDGTPGGDLENLYQLPQPFESSLDYYSATVNWDLGGPTFTSATSFSRTHNVQSTDQSITFGTFWAGLAPFRVDLELEKWTQEFRLASPTGGKVEWLIGAYYTDEEGTNGQLLNVWDPTGQPIAGLDPGFLVSIPSKYQEYAGFGDLTYRFTDALDLTVGVRWAKNEQDFVQNISGALAGDPISESGSSSEDVFTYMVSPRWHLNADTMLYARVATGYRPGGPQAPILDVPQSVDSDTLTNYEVGLKSEFLDRRALVNVAVFRIDWDDIQQFVLANGISGLTNAGKARTEGVELETAFSPLAGLRLGLNAAYTDATLEESPAGEETDNSRINKVPGPLPNVSKWTGSLTADYSFAIGSEWEAQVGTGYRYVGEQGTALVTLANNLNYILPSYDVVDLHAGITRDQWTVRLFARNVTDERAYTGGVGNVGAVTVSPVPAANTPTLLNVSVLQPRTVGISVDVRF